MIEPLDEDLLLISRIKGLRSKNAHVQAQTSKMREILADWQEHQERESEQKLQRRRRTVKVLEKFLRSQKVAFAAWRGYIQEHKRQKRQLHQEEQQTALQDLRESKRLELLVIYSWRCSMLQEKLACLVDERDQASANACKAHQAHQLQLNSMRLRLLKERRSHQLADTRATLAGLQVLGAHLPFGVAPCATSSELSALSFCAWHLTAMSGARGGKAALSVGSVGTKPSARGKSHERSGAKALQLSCRIARRMALQCLAAWREFRAQLARPASQRSRSSRLKESPNAKVIQKESADAKESRWLLLQAFLNWRCVSVTLLCERRVQQEAKAAASECAALQLQVDHWRHQCKEASERPVTAPAALTPSHVLLAWRFVSESQRALRAQRSLAKVFTAWTVVIREIASRICRNSRHTHLIVDTRAECERDLKCSGKETAVLRLIFLALQMNVQAYRAEREGFFRQSNGEASPKVLVGPKMGAPDLKDVFLAWHSCQEHRASDEEMCSHNAKETWQTWDSASPGIATQTVKSTRCLLWMSFHAFRMAVCGESSMAGPAGHQSGDSAQGGSTSQSALCEQMEQMQQTSFCERTHVVKDFEPHLSRVTAAGPTPGDKAKCAAANPAGPLPPVGSPRDPVKAVFAALSVDSPETVDDSPGSAGWTSSMSIVGEQSGARGSPSALSPAMWPDQLDFPCSARIVEKPCNG